MSPNLPATTKPQITAGAPVAALVPQNLDEAFRLSSALAASGMAPRGMDKPEQIMVAILAGAELGLAPFQSLQSFAVVNGRPTLWGDGLIAVVRSHGVRVTETLSGDGEAMEARCVAMRPDTGEEITRSFTVADAKKAGLWGKTGPWQQYPKRMLQMRARALALRDGCADMLRGMQVREEVEDFSPARTVTSQASGVAARLQAAAPAQTSEGFSASVGEILDGDYIPEFEAAEAPAEAEVAEVAEQPAEPATQAPAATEGPTTAQIAAMYEERLRGATSTTKLQSLRTANTKLRERLDAADPERLAELEDLFNERFAELEEAERAGA